MSHYEPDVWVALKLVNGATNETWYRLLSGWYGGYAGGDSWKMSSGVEKVTKKETLKIRDHKDRLIHINRYDVLNSSGSVYTVCETNYRTSGLTHTMFELYANKAKEANNGSSLSIIPIEEFFAQFPPGDE